MNTAHKPIILSICLNDGGKSQSRRPKQKNSCTVIATAIAFNMSYDAAFDLMQIHGRENNKGLRYDQFLNQYPDYARKISGTPRNANDYQTVAQWIPRLQNGKFIVHVDCHVFAVIDGVIHDKVPVQHWGTVYHVYQVTKDMENGSHDIGDWLADAL